MPTPHAWLLAFLATAAVEVPVVVALTGGHPTPAWRRALIAIFAQLVTHPLVWFVFPRLVGLTGGSSLVLSELWAWLAEAAFYAVVLPGLSSARALGTSAVANGASLLFGLVIF
jgi:hypothetical protein